MRLKDKVAIVTGASRGIGEAIAKGYAKEGAKVVIASRKQAGLEPVAADIEAAGGTVKIIPTHTGDLAQVEHLIKHTVDTFGRLDILVNNAATNPHFGPVMTSELSHWQKIFEVNVFGYFFMSKFAAEQMMTQGGGKIINVASVLGIEPGPMMGVYSSSKAAVIMQTKVLAQELGADNIQVNAIAPGIIKTKFAEALWGNEQILNKLEGGTPAGRLGNPEDLVEAALFLATSDYVTGTVVTVDGGLTLSSM